MDSLRRLTTKCLLISCGIAAFAPLSLAESEVAGSRIDLRISPVIDMHYYLKTMIRKNDNQVPPEFADAVAVLREIDTLAKTQGLSWGSFESNMYDCDTALQVHDIFSKLPETTRPRRPRQSAKEIPMRAPAVKLAKKYIALEPLYLKDHWPARKTRLNRLLADVNTNFMPKTNECFAYMLKHFAMEDPKQVIPVYLVVDMPFPGAHTYRRHGGGGLCIVSIGPKTYEGSLLYESILHEATHALDNATSGDNVFDTLRSKLKTAGLTRRNDLYHDVPHTIYFVQTAETIRRIVNPDHEHYGVVSRYYDRVSKRDAPIGQKVRDVWTDYLDGKITRDAAVDELVDWTVEKATKR